MTAVRSRHIRLATGVLTAAYGAAVALRPATLLGPARLASTHDNRRLAHVIGARDIASGALLILGTGRWAAPAVAARVLADASDIITFGALCPRGAKVKAVAIASAWGAVCALGHPALDEATCRTHT